MLFFMTLTNYFEVKEIEIQFFSEIASASAKMNAITVITLKDHNDETTIKLCPFIASPDRAPSIKARSNTSVDETALLVNCLWQI